MRLDPSPPEGVERSRVKDVVEVLDDPPLIDPAMLELTRWMADEYAQDALQLAVDNGRGRSLRHHEADLLQASERHDDAHKARRPGLRLPRV